MMKSKLLPIILPAIAICAGVSADEWSYLFCRADDGEREFRYVINETALQADIFGVEDYQAKPVQPLTNGFNIEWLENRDQAALRYSQQDHVSNTYLQRHTLNTRRMTFEVIFRRYIGLPNPTPTSHAVAETESVQGSCSRSR